MWKLTLAALCATLGCIQPDLVLCADGLACPTGDRCDDVHRACVVPDQLTVCAGLAEGADCTAGPVSGGCFGNVCLPRGCGNQVIEPGEMCDDGNQISGDGCSGDCRSTERCGNGVVDPGEQCDDGNLVSRDGCDSQCRLETAAWRSVAIAPGYVDARKAAYDAARGRLVTVHGEGDTWEWDGARWTVTPSTINPFAVFYDPDLQQVEMIGLDAVSAIHVYAWEAGAWTVIHSDGPSTGDSDSISGLVAAYDPVGHRVLAVEMNPHTFPGFGAVQAAASASEADAPATRAWSMDATGAWTQLASVPALLYDMVAAFDPDASQLVVEDDTGTEWIYDGTTWTSSASGFGQHVSLALDPDRGHLVLVDGQSQTMYERAGGVWSAVPDSAAPCTQDDFRLLYYNPTSAALELFNTDSSAICTWHAPWTVRIPALPFRPVGATYDPVTHSLVVLHDARASDPAAGIESWRLTDAGWERIATPHAPSGRGDALAVYSAGRAATVLYGGWITDGRIADTWGFDGADWSQLAPALSDPDSDATRAAVYDSTHGRVVLMINDAWWSLSDGDDAWHPVDLPGIDGYAAALAWDARNATLVAIGQFTAGGSLLMELAPQGWTPFDLVPGDINPTYPATLMSDPRAGGVLAFNLGTGAAWERSGRAWSKLPAIPVQQADHAWTAYNPVDGGVLYVATTISGVFAAVMTRTSATPLESCKPGEDLDGDGLAGCDDPDCYWACSRPSPYAARR